MLLYPSTLASFSSHEILTIRSMLQLQFLFPNGEEYTKRSSSRKEGGQRNGTQLLKSKYGSQELNLVRLILLNIFCYFI